MKIPFQDASPAKSEALPTPYGNLNLNNLGGGLDNAIGQVGEAAQSIERSVAEQNAKEEAARKKAQEEAEKIANANADAAYQKRETEALQGGSNRRDLIEGAFTNGSDPTSADVQGKPGFLETRGLDASAQSSKTLENLAKAREDIAAGTFTDQAAKERWLARSAGMFEDSRRKVETHVYQQRGVAAQDALTGQLAASVQAVPGSTSDQVAAMGRRDADSIRGLQTSKEGGDAAVAKHWSDLASAHVLDLVSQGQIGEARSAYNGSKLALNEQAREHVEREIVHAEATQAQAGKDLDGERAASTAVRDAVDPKSGWVNNAKALAAVEALPATTEKEVAIKTEARLRLAYQLKIAEEVKSQTIVSRFNSALSAYQQSGTISAVSTDDKTWLKNKANKSTGSEADAWERLRAIARADAEHARGATTTPDEQRAFGQFVIWAASNPDKAATMTEEQFNAQVVGGGDYQGQGTQAGPLAKKDRERAAAVLASYHGKAAKPEALTSEERNLLIEHGTESQTFGQGRDVTKWDQAQVDNLTNGEAKLSAYKAMVRQTTGKDPTQKEIEAKIVSITTQHPIPGTGWFGTNAFPKKKSEVEGYAAPAVDEPTTPGTTPIGPTEQKAKQDPKRVVGYAYSPDKKLRRARLADGTLGPSEQVH